MRLVLVFLFCLVVHCRGGEVDEGDPAQDNWISRLYQDKLKGYNSQARPVTDSTHNTTVHLALSLNRVDVNDERQEFSVSAWSIMTWVDEHLRWVPENYMNINRIHFDDNDIWMPDMKIYNSADGSDVHPFDRVPVLVDNHGNVYWFPPTHITVNCDMDLTRWPSDEHECVVRMGSWSHHGEQIDIKVMPMNDTEGVMNTNLEVNNRWQLVKVKATRNLTTLEGHDPYVEVNYAFTVKRQASTHAQYLTNTALALVMVVLAAYSLPLASFFPRLVMHLFALGVLITCYFTFFNELPANGGPVPVVVRYFSGTIILTTISLLLTVLLTGRGWCCSPAPYSSSYDLGKRLAGAVGSTRVLRNVVPKVRASAPYNHLETEMVIDEEEGVMGQPVQSSPQEESLDVVTMTGVAPLTLRIINGLLALLFTVAFVVDYVVLKGVAV